MTKTDLLNLGYRTLIVEFRNGIKGLYVTNSRTILTENGFVNMNRVSEDLKNKDLNSFDIVKIYRPKYTSLSLDVKELIWERKELIKASDLKVGEAMILVDDNSNLNGAMVIYLNDSYIVSKPHGYIGKLIGDMKLFQGYKVDPDTEFIITTK